MQIWIFIIKNTVSIMCETRTLHYVIFWKYNILCEYLYLLFDVIFSDIKMCLQKHCTPTTFKPRKLKVNINVTRLLYFNVCQIWHLYLNHFKSYDKCQSWQCTDRWISIIRPDIHTDRPKTIKLFSFKLITLFVF